MLTPPPEYIQTLTSCHGPVPTILLWATVMAVLWNDHYSLASNPAVVALLFPGHTQQSEWSLTVRSWFTTDSPFTQLKEPSPSEGPWGPHGLPFPQPPLLLWQSSLHFRAPAIPRHPVWHTPRLLPCIPFISAANHTFHGTWLSCKMLGTSYMRNSDKIWNSHVIRWLWGGLLFCFSLVWLS